MKKRVTGLLLIMTVVMTVFAGCGKIKFEPETSSIYVKKDGTVISADMEPFEGSNYSEDELKTYVENAVKAYNSAKGAPAEAYADEKDKDTVLPVKVNSLKVDKGTASLFLEYAGCGDYLTFTGTAGTEGGIYRLELSTVGETTLEGTFKNAKGEDVTLDGVTKKDSNPVVIVEGPVTMQVEGTIQFVSTGVTVDGKRTVTTPAGSVSYIVFK